MINYPNSPSFSPRSPTIAPWNSIPSWGDQHWRDRDSYQQRQLKRLQALLPPVQPPPLQLGHLTPTQEYQLQRLRRLVAENQPIPTFHHWRATRATSQFNSLAPTTGVAVRRSPRTSPSPTYVPAIRKPRRTKSFTKSFPGRVRRPNKRVTHFSPRLRAFFHLITRYGWALCGATWIILVISGGLAGKLLINPEYATTYSAAYESPASQIQNPQAKPFWSLHNAISHSGSLAGIALGGAGATWLIAQYFKAD